MFVQFVSETFAEPIIGKIDVFVKSHEPEITRVQNAIVESSWFQRVNNVIGFDTFFQTAKQEYTALTTSSRDEFIARLKLKLNVVWDERLMPMADSFFKYASDSKTKIKENSQQVWNEIEHKVREMYEQKLLTVYNSKVLCLPSVNSRSLLTGLVRLSLPPLSFTTLP